MLFFVLNTPEASVTLLFEVVVVEVAAAFWFTIMPPTILLPSLSFL